MALRSELFRDDTRLQACLVQDSAHVTPGTVGTFVNRIQLALRIVDNAFIDETEFASGTYGPTTTLAVRAFKTSRNILNFAGQIDDVVGKKTIAALDDELVGSPLPRADVINRAFADSRSSLVAVQNRLLALQLAIDNAAALPEPDRTLAMVPILTTHARNIQVLSRRLVLVSADPLSTQFRDALAKVLALIGDNLSRPMSIRDDGLAGRCAGGPPFAATTASDPDPKVSVCDPFFTASRDLQRDVLTHEYFHVLGLGDHSVTNTAEALTNANTVAQVVALIHDRFRQANSDGNEPAIPPFVSP